MSPTSRGSLKKIHDHIEYYPHQLEGIRRMAYMGSLILADDMGLGKTLQALTVAAIDFEMDRANSVLVVTPASLKWNWATELDTFTNFTYTILDGTPKKRNLQLEEFETDVLIMNYEQVISHVDQLTWMNFDIVIMDEAHYIKNHKSNRTAACLKLPGRRFMLLTGSPLLNHVDDLWALLNRIDPLEYPKYYRFVNRYAVYGGFKDKQIIGVKNESELHGRLQAVMVRRRKGDVLDLPDKQYINIVVGLHPEQQRLYRQARDELMIDLPDNPDPMELENVLTRFLRLKQICGTTATLEGYEDHSYKLDRAVEMISEMRDAGEHVVVFTQFRGVLRALELRCQKAGIWTYVLHGDVPVQDRVSTVKEWAHAEPGPLIAMLQVAGVGLNMTKASKCIFLDKLYVPKLNEQAEDRLHRIGADKTHPVQIYHLYCKGTIEDRIEQILQGKRKVFDKLVEESSWKKALYKAMKEEESNA